MVQDKLRLNDAKTEFLIIGTRAQLNKVTISDLQVGVVNRMAFRMRMRCWCGGNVQGVCPGFILALLISVFFAIFHMEAPENTQEFFSIAFL